ncbi:hypothetical protein ABPG75_011601 [Micractinium tetrahymenae]
MVRKVQPTDFTSTWKHALEQDGWYQAHDALRADLAALQQMLGCFRTQLGAGLPLTRAQAAAAGRFLAAHLTFFHHHHHNEDDIAVPYLRTRCEMPDKISADHAQLEAQPAPTPRSEPPLLDRLEQQMGRLLSPTALTCIQQRALLEVAAVRGRAIVRSMDATSVGVFLRPMSREQRRAFARQEGIPFFIRWLLFRQAAKYEKKVWQPFERECLQAGA